MRTAADMNSGEEAIIAHFSDSEVSLKLMEMGCLPGEKIRMERIAPLGDPVAFRVSGYFLMLRLEEARVIVIS